MDDLKEIRKIIVVLIEDYFNGKIDFETFNNNLPNFEKIDQDEIASQAIHMVDHYESDQDIMSRDPEYKKYMDKEVMNSIIKLREV